MSLNSEQITALAQAEADAAVSSSGPRRRWSHSSPRIVALALALLAAGWTLAVLMWWSGRWPVSQAITAAVATAALALLVAAIARAVSAAREALEVVDAHD